MKTRGSAWIAQTLTLAALAVGCSGSGSGNSIPTQATGGVASSSGGAPVASGGQANVTVGGTSNVNGNSGGAPSGGVAPSLGGAPAAGGTTNTPATGGVNAGGATASGGKATGGTAVTGGSATGGVSAGGTSATGGARTGGAPAQGGSASGGASATGGKSGASAGATSTGTPSSGCSVTTTPPTGKAIDNTMTVAGQSTTRQYRLSVPTDYIPGEALPLIFVFNGVGGTGPQAQTGFNLETGHRAIFVYPTSLPNSQAGGSIAWDFSATGVDVPFFDALVTYVEQTYCVDTSKIFALGASSGGIFSNMLGCFRGDVLRAIAPASGMTWQQSGCKGDVAVMIICGAQDTYNACNDAKNGAVSETNVWVPQNTCSTTTAASPISDICVAYQGCKPADPVLLCTQPGGHGWLPSAYANIWWQFFMSLS